MLNRDQFYKQFVGGTGISVLCGLSSLAKPGRWLCQEGRYCPWHLLCSLLPDDGVVKRSQTWHGMVDTRDLFRGRQ